MSNTIEIPQSNNQFVQQFSRAVLDYELFILEERHQKKQGRSKNRGIKKLKNSEYPKLLTYC